MGTMSRVTHASGIDIDNIHSLGSPKSLENGQKVDIGVEKTMPEMKKERLLTLRNHGNVPMLKPGRID